MPLRERGIFFMAHFQGEARGQQTLFPVTLDDLIPADRMCRAITCAV